MDGRLNSMVETVWMGDWIEIGWDTMDGTVWISDWLTWKKMHNRDGKIHFDLR